jgi:hypothetical protein
MLTLFLATDASLFTSLLTTRTLAQLFPGRGRNSELQPII